MNASLFCDISDHFVLIPYKSNINKQLNKNPVIQSIPWIVNFSCKQPRCSALIQHISLFILHTEKTMNSSSLVYFFWLSSLTSISWQACVDRFFLRGGLTEKNARRKYPWIKQKQTCLKLLICWWILFVLVQWTCLFVY